MPQELACSSVTYVTYAEQKDVSQTRWAYPGATGATRARLVVSAEEETDGKEGGGVEAEEFEGERG